MFKHKTQFVPLYRIKVDKPNTKKWNVQSHSAIFVSIQKKKKKKKERTAGVVPHNKKAKGSDSAFKDKHTMHLMGTGAGLVT